MNKDYDKIGFRLAHGPIEVELTGLKKYLPWSKKKEPSVNDNTFILHGSIKHYYEAVIKTLKLVETDYHQLTISPALFQGISRDSKEYHAYLTEIERIIEFGAELQIIHIDESFLITEIFQHWLLKAEKCYPSKQNRPTIELFDNAYKNIQKKLHEWSIINPRVRRHQVKPLGDSPEQPLAFLISVANRKNPDKMVALLSSFEFEDSIPNSSYKGFYTENCYLAQQIDHILRIYVETTKI